MNEPWSKQENELLVQLWTTADIDTILAAFPQRSYRAIAGRANRLNIRRPYEQIVKVRSQQGQRSMAKRKQRYEQQVDEAFQPVQIVVKADAAAPINLARVLRNPLEAAWRGAL